MRVLLVGLGLHARRVHYPLLEELTARGRVTLCAVVDRRAQAGAVSAYLRDRPAPAPPLVVVSEPTPGRDLPAETVAALDALADRERPDAVLVATEPLMHRAYAQWAFTRGLHTLLDKPPVGRPGVVADARCAERMAQDLDDLIRRAARSGRLGGVLTQRRYHRGYRYARRLVREVCGLTGCPPTSIIVEHGDGEWRMPWEVLTQGYHPFNQGYGVLLHSGYHAVDTGLWLAGVTEPGHGGYTAATVSAQFTTYADMLAALPEKRIRMLLEQRHGSPAGTAAPPVVPGAGGDTAVLGEIDARLTIELQRDGATPTVLSVMALHSTNSRRGWLDPTGRNLYTGNGRRVQESVTIHQGPFQSIRIHSYRARLPGEPRADSATVGGARHWTIQVLRNTSVFPQWSAAEERSLDDLPDDDEALAGASWADAGGARRARNGRIRDGRVRDEVGAAKCDLITDFLRVSSQAGRVRTGPAFASDLGSHKVTMEVIAAAYRACNAGGNGPRRVTVTLEGP